MRDYLASGSPGTEELLFLPLGGAGEIGMNLNLYGHDGAWLMVMRTKIIWVRFLIYGHSFSAPYTQQGLPPACCGESSLNSGWKTKCR